MQFKVKNVDGDLTLGESIVFAEYVYNISKLL